ncbi:heat-inducible transcriptional repressor HrcA [candidate division KSB1 bacterium]
MLPDDLNTRKELVLRSVIHHYILTAKPVGSRVISKKYGLSLSPATIRNVMADLEDEGYLMHPHTSAGRVPTTRGYRMYVNNLMMVEKLNQNLKRAIRNNVESINKNVDDLLGKTSQILSTISNQLGVVIGPSLDKAVIEKISLVSVASDKVLIIISLGAGIIRSVVVEIHSDIDDREIDATSELLNERLSGLPVGTIIKEIDKRLKNVSRGSNELIRLFVDSANKFFKFDEKKIFIGGASNIAEQPEFNKQDKLKSVIELVERKDVVVHLLNRSDADMGIVIRIGEENETEVGREFSIVSTEYSIGDKTGTLGVIGPIRMWYPKLIPLVDYTAGIINKVLKKEN